MLIVTSIVEATGREIIIDAEHHGDKCVVTLDSQGKSFI
jgi:hypothetical protein